LKHNMKISHRTYPMFLWPKLHMHTTLWLSSTYIHYFYYLCLFASFLDFFHCLMFWKPCFVNLICLSPITWWQEQIQFPKVVFLEHQTMDKVQKPRAIINTIHHCQNPLELLSSFFFKFYLSFYLYFLQQPIDIFCPHSSERCA
jgi:hypothetical protein